MKKIIVAAFLLSVIWIIPAFADDPSGVYKPLYPISSGGEACTTPECVAKWTPPKEATQTTPSKSPVKEIKKAKKQKVAKKAEKKSACWLEPYAIAVGPGAKAEVRFPGEKEEKREIVNPPASPTLGQTPALQTAPAPGSTSPAPAEKKESGISSWLYWVIIPQAVAAIILAMFFISRRQSRENAQAQSATEPTAPGEAGPGGPANVT